MAVERGRERELAPWWWPTADAAVQFIDRWTLTAVVCVLLYGLFDPKVDNKDIFSLLTMIIGYYIGKRERAARERLPENAS
jgi:hypothetical protein